MDLLETDRVICALPSFENGKFSMSERPEAGHFTLHHICPGPECLPERLSKDLYWVNLVPTGIRFNARLSFQMERRRDVLTALTSHKVRYTPVDPPPASIPHAASIKGLSRWQIKGLIYYRGFSLRDMYLILQTHGQFHLAPVEARVLVPF